MLITITTAMYGISLLGAGITAKDLVQPEYKNIEGKMMLIFKRGEIGVQKKEAKVTGEKNQIPMLYPKLVKKGWEGKNIVLYYKLPVGLGMEKIIEKIGVICDGLGSEVLIKQLEGDFKSDLKMTVLHGHLRDKISYTNEAQLIPKDGKIYIPIGWSRRGFEYCDVGNAENAHALIAGTSGSGKSTLLRFIITSLHLNYDETDVNLWLADFKNGAEFSLFKQSVLVKESIDNVFFAEEFFTKLLKECERRYTLLGSAGTPDIEKYNKKFPDKKLPRIFLLVDELSMLEGLKVPLIMLKQLGAIGRAGGVHLLLSTQRPSADILDGTLKSNLGIIVGFRTKNPVSSRVILGEKDARLAYIDPETPGRCILQTVRDVKVQVPEVTADQCLAMMIPYYTTTQVKIKKNGNTDTQYRKST